MLIAIDIGNSNIKIGGFSAEEEPIFTMSLSALEPRSADEYANALRMGLKERKIELSKITDCAIASVVPALTPLMASAMQALCSCRILELGAGVRTGISVRTDSPAEVGADIIANAAAAAAKSQEGAIIADFGTATTIFAVNAKNELLGGAILTGLRASAESLRASAAQLPAVPLQAGKELIGKNTADCIANGVLLGHVYAIEGFAERFRALLGGAPRLIATGGLASLILPHTTLGFEKDPHLTLKGLRIIYGKTRKIKIS
ncbi:MAG: type III pantothenate kinase [Clostridia bacterium]|nr:type III pantothenate kinase [Clostridia bacterium]